MEEGAHGDFQVGALRYLYNHGIYPQIICGTSVGAINGVKLAEGGDYQSEGIACYVLTAPTGKADGELLRLLNPTTGDHFYTTSRTELQNAIDNLGYVFEQVACYVLTAPTGDGDGELFQMVNPTSGDHFYTTSRTEFQNAKDNLGYVYEKVTCYVFVTQKPGTVPLYRLRRIYESLDVGLVKGVMASASIPIFFPPVKFQDEWYVDGGVREILPIQAAIDLGADRVFGIIATKATIPDKSYDNADMVRIAERTVDIMTDETQKNEFNPPLGWGIPITIIQPTVDIHDILTIAPGMISITMAYGFMRAADMIDLPPGSYERCRLLADMITELRNEILALETYARTNNVLFNQQARDELVQTRSLKRQLKALVNERWDLGGVSSVPADAQTWWQQWERRSDPPFIATPWDAVVDDKGIVLVEAEPSP